MSADAEQVIHAATLRVRADAPFFGALILFARMVPQVGIGTAATDGDAIFYEPAFMAELRGGQAEAVLLHEILHCALLHVHRRGARDPGRWNVAADIVVNGMIARHERFHLPEGALRSPEIEHLPAEEVYELLPREAEVPVALFDLRISESPDSKSQTTWRGAVQRAAVVARSLDAGSLPAGFDREFAELSPSRVDWRTRLWQFLVQTPCDFSGFDRRFVGRGLYLDAIEGESLIVDVAIDTSASVDQELLTQFLSELRGILRTYPHIDCRLFYADAELYGPWDLRRGEDPPRPAGGGGTSFEPFFARLDRDRPGRQAAVCIYLTDGFGDFPARAPHRPVLWVVPPGGLDAGAFPFGNVVRLRGR